MQSNVFFLSSRRTRSTGSEDDYMCSKDELPKSHMVLSFGDSNSSTNEAKKENKSKKKENVVAAMLNYIILLLESF